MSFSRVHLFISARAADFVLLPASTDFILFKCRVTPVEFPTILFSQVARPVFVPGSYYVFLLFVFLTSASHFMQHPGILGFRHSSWEVRGCRRSSPSRNSPISLLTLRAIICYRLL